MSRLILDFDVVRETLWDNVCIVCPYHFTSEPFNRMLDPMDFTLGLQQCSQNHRPQERRSQERYDLELPVTVRWKDRSGRTRESTGTTQNMSPSGAFIVCDGPIGKGFAIDVHINIPVALGGYILSRISAKGKVVRDVTQSGPVGTCGHGIMFDHFSFTRL